MKKSLLVFILLCSVLLEVQSLECYVCDNCAKVKLDQIQTCGPTTVPEQSTTKITITESPTITTVAAKLSSSTSTTLKTTTRATSEVTTISSTITTEDTTMKTTEATPTTTTTTKATTTSTTVTRPSSTEYTTPPATSLTAGIEHTNTPITPEPINSSTGAIISTSSFDSTITEPQTINTPAEASITTEPMTLATITVDATISSTTTFTEHTNTPNEQEKGFITEPVISSVTITESSPAEASVSFISTLPATTTVTIENFSATEPTIQSFSTMTTSSKQDADTLIQNSPTLPTLTAGAITTEYTPKIPIISATNYPESTVNNISPNKQTNGTYNLRRKRSSSEGCACKNKQKCDCWTHERSKRYASRGLGLSKEGVKYVCFVDKYEINETEVVKRGCAIKEEEEVTLCKNLGFGANCKICDTNQCNGAAIIQSSILLIFTLYLINK